MEFQQEPGIFEIINMNKNKEKSSSTNVSSVGQKIDECDEIMPIKGLNFYFMISRFLNKLEFYRKTWGIPFPN